MKKVLRTVLNLILTIIISCLSIALLALPFEVIIDPGFIIFIVAPIVVLIICYILKVRYEIKYRYYACSALCSLAMAALFYESTDYASYAALVYACVLFAFYLIGLLIDTIALHIRKVKKAKNISDSK